MKKLLCLLLCVLLLTACGSDTLTITMKASDAGTKIGSDQIYTEARGTFIKVDVSIQNTGSDKISVDPNDFTLVVDSHEYKTFPLLTEHCFRKPQEINAGIILDEILYFDVGTGMSSSGAELHYKGEKV